MGSRDFGDRRTSRAGGSDCRPREWVEWDAKGSAWKPVG